MIKETWKPIKNFERYLISNFGRVWSLKSNKFIKPYINNYYQIRIEEKGKKYTLKIHRLVAEAFIPNPHNYPCVNHKDENKLNNSVENLEWCDSTYNLTYGTARQRAKKTNTNGKLSKTVLQYTLDGQFVREWASAAEAGRNGFHQGHISDCCRGKLKTHKDFIWRYK